MAMEGHCRKKLSLGLMCSVSLASCPAPRGRCPAASINILLQLCPEHACELTACAHLTRASHSGLSGPQASSQGWAGFPTSLCTHLPASTQQLPGRLFSSRHGHKCPKTFTTQPESRFLTWTLQGFPAASAIRTPEGCFLLAGGYGSGLAWVPSTPHITTHVFQQILSASLKERSSFRICSFLGHSLSFRIFCIFLLSPSLTLKELIIFNINIPLFK